MIELNSIVDLERVYIIRKPSPFIRSDECFKITKVFYCNDYRTYNWFTLRSIQQKYTGDRIPLFLTFPELALLLKFHPTGLYNWGGKIEYVDSVDSASDEENEDED